MRLLTDEHLSPLVAEGLRARGHDAVTVVEGGINGVDDAGVLSWAVERRRAVVTANVQDFRLLHATYLTTSKLHYGILLVPSRRYSLRRGRLGPLVDALDQLLLAHPDDDALCDAERLL